MASFSLEGKVCIVTGAASGIGLATVKAFLEAGAEGVMMADVTDEHLQDALSSIPTQWHDCCVVCSAGDVVNESTHKDYVEKTMDRWGRVDVSVQCAGVLMDRKPIVDITVDEWEHIMDINAKGVFLGVKHSVAAMLASPSGGKDCSLILISSNFGLEGGAGYGAYSASKFAVRGLMQAAAQEYGPKGIRVNAVMPGPIDTPMVKDYPKEEMDKSIAHTNLGRIGEADEVASTCVFLASSAGRNCSGSSLKVDGGWTKFA